MDKKILTLIIPDDDIKSDDLDNTLKDVTDNVKTSFCCNDCVKLANLDKFDCIIIDYMQPNDEVIELIKKLKERHTHCPVVVIAGKGDEKLVSLIMKIGACDYIPRDNLTKESLVSSVKNSIKFFEMKRKNQEQIDYYKRFYNTVPVGFFKTRISDGLIIHANQFLVQMIGYKTKEEIIRKVKMTNFYVNENSRNELLNIIKEDGTIEDFEIEMKRKNGSRLWVSITAKICPKEDCIEGSARDITKRKNMALEIKKLKEKEIEWLKEIDMFLKDKLKSYEEKDPLSENNS